MSDTMNDDGEKSDQETKEAGGKLHDKRRRARKFER